MGNSPKEQLGSLVTKGRIVNNESEYFDLTNCVVLIFKTGRSRCMMGVFRRKTTVQSGEIYTSLDGRYIGKNDKKYKEGDDVAIRDIYYQINCTIVSILDSSFDIIRMIMKNNGIIGDYIPKIATQEEINEVLAYVELNMYPPNLPKLQKKTPTSNPYIQLQRKGLIK